MPPTSEIIHAYRSIYRASLRAVQYAKPNRYTARDLLRKSFRKEPATAFNKEALDRTIVFLQNAARETGLEHKLVKNLLRVAWERNSTRR